ncbi:hypothetical protein PT974_02914 [Cladobotryum mycophilum]|uniref:Uncharacterized protein n=1 Tax=Cladobotryum mycophilum TaxID=491253 RepID=A0ABR0T0L9_9HYPO
MACDQTSSLDELVRALGYEPNDLKTTILLDSMQNFVSEYTADDGTKGTDLLDWQWDRKHLEVLSDTFLDATRKMFWPDDSPFMMEMTNNTEKLYDMVPMLFFRYIKHLTRDPTPCPDPPDHSRPLRRLLGLDSRLIYQEPAEVKYEVYRHDSEHFESHEWRPRPDFKAATLAELLEEIPGGHNVKGVRLTLISTVCTLSRYAFSEADFSKFTTQARDLID